MAVVYSYIRFSTRKQLEGDSLRRQREDGEAWVRRHGHTLADKELHDLGVSAFRGKNLDGTNKLAVFLEDIKAGRVKPGSILLVENLDRLSRAGIKEARKVFEAILEAGVQVAVLRPHEQVFTLDSVNADPMALMAPLWSFHLAWMESKNKADRLRRLWDKKRATAAEKGPGYKFDKRGPSWLDWDDDKKVFVMNKWAEAVRFIFEMTAEGSGQRSVLAGLVEKFRGRRWNTSFVQKVLADRAVLGERQPKTSDDKGNRVAVGKVIVGYYPAVVSEELWYRAQATKANNLKAKGPKGKFVNLFTGLVRNAHDRQPMHVQVGRAKRDNGVYVQRRLVSYGHTSRVPDADPVTVAYPEFEAVLLRHLSELRAEDLESKTGQSELKAKEQELAGVQKHLARLEDDMANPSDDGEYQSLKAAATKTRAKADALRAVVEKMKEELSADQPLVHAQDIMKVLENADDDQKHVLRLRLRSLIAELVDTVFVKPEKHYGRVWTLVQVNYRSGLVRQVGFGPGWVTTGSAAGECPAYGVDLRDQKACRKPRLRELAAMLCKPAPAPKVKEVPGTVGAAADLFLAIRRSEMAKDSFRVVPSKVKRFVDFVGADVRCGDLSQQHWNLFKRWLAAEVKDKKMEKTTARVTHNRVREFLFWLVDRGAAAVLDFGGSAAAALK